MSRWRDLLQPERSTDRHRELARPLQHQAAALCTWLSTTRTTGDQTTARPDAHHELTSHSAWYKISVRPMARDHATDKRGLNIELCSMPQNTVADKKNPSIPIAEAAAVTGL